MEMGGKGKLHWECLHGRFAGRQNRYNVEPGELATLSQWGTVNGFIGIVHQIGHPL